MTMTEPENIQSQDTRTVTPAGIKRKRPEDENGSGLQQRVTQRTESEHDFNESMVRIVVEDLRSNDKTILERAMGKLRKFLFVHCDLSKVAQHQKAFFRVGGHLAVVRVMKEHPDCKMVQTHGICVLCNASCKNPVIRAAIATVQGIQVILAAMQRFSSDQVIIYSGFRALCNIVLNEANADVLVTKICGIPFLVGLMNEFHSDAVVMSGACQLLTNLCCFPQVRGAIADANAVTALAVAYDSHKEFPRIRALAGAALKLLV
jgi:hypothetical protein